MSTVNNRNKKYWIRYNPGADRLEQEITSGGKKPKGRGWAEVDVDRCCNLVPNFMTFPVELDLVCTDSFDTQPYIALTFVGQDGQGTFTVNVIDGSTEITIPKSIGDFILFIDGQSTDFIRARLMNSSDAVITGAVTDASGHGESGVFDISLVDHIEFGCVDNE